MSTEHPTIGEKWASDLENIKNGAHVYTTVPQCERCRNYVKGNALHCSKYIDETKPQDVLFASKECLHFDSAEKLNVSLSDPVEKGIYGGLFGFVVGDVLGVPVEFSSRNDRDADPVREMRAYGTYRQPFGAWSDDSSLMLCLADAFNQGFSLETLKKNMISYYTDGAFTPEGKMFDIGVSTAEAIRRMTEGIPETECGGNGERDNGNGSLMRILPLAFVSPYISTEELLKLVADVSSMTHRHKRSVLACIIYTLFAGNLFSGKTLTEAYDDAIRTVRRDCIGLFDIEKAAYRYVLDKSVIGLDRRRIKSTGYVVDTLEAVIWSLFNTSSYEEAVLTAVNLGGDTDTIAALTGGLAGILYGFDQIPDRWIQTVLRKETIADICADFVGCIRKLQDSR